MPSLIAIAYVSSANPDLSSHELDTLLLDAREFNSRMSVTGALLHHDGSFFQYLEGPEAGVEQVYSRIQGARRHRGLIEIFREPIVRRHFSAWSMGFSESTASEMQSISQASWNTQLQAAVSKDQGINSPGLKILLSFWQRARKTSL
ncbi:MAG: BLUF domain-containing protein [Gammaproteobacteria bacterium]